MRIAARPRALSHARFEGHEQIGEMLWCTFSSELKCCVRTGVTSGTSRSTCFHDSGVQAQRPLYSSSPVAAHQRACASALYSLVTGITTSPLRVQAHTARWAQEMKIARAQMVPEQ